MKISFSDNFFIFLVSQLREHWEDTSQKVQSRKQQLEELTVDHRHFEAKYQEIDAWLSRMEIWQNRLKQSKDIHLEQPTREQKVSLFMFIYLIHRDDSF